MVEPATAKFFDGERLKTQRGGCAGFKLRMDLCSHLFHLVKTRPDSWSMPNTLFVIGEVPDLATEIAANTPHAKRFFACHIGHQDPFREFPRDKTPQKGISEKLSKTQKRASQQVGTHGQQSKRRGGIQAVLIMRDFDRSNCPVRLERIVGLLLPSKRCSQLSGLNPSYRYSTHNM